MQEAWDGKGEDKWHMSFLKRAKNAKSEHIIGLSWRKGSRR